MQHIRVLSLLCIMSLAAVIAQEDVRPAIATEPLFQNLVGNWQGEGWSMLGPNQRVEFIQTESVETKANGHVVVVEGLGRDKETNVLAFQAFGIFSYNLVDENYNFTAHQTNGYAISVVPEIGDDHFQWGFDTGQGLVRYTATITDSTWSQIGEFSPDGGENWFQNFEMNLSKIEEAN